MEEKLFNYSISKGEVTITGCKTKPVGKLVIPETIEGYPVTTISCSAFAFCDALTSVEMPNVTTIGYVVDSARDTYGEFCGCRALTSVEMPIVTTVGKDAFARCSSLTSAYFYSDAPTEFGKEVFDYCAENFTIYYAVGTSGWTTPTWHGYPAQPFEAVKHTVTFVDGLTGETIATATVNHYNDAQMPEAPEHEGYTFTGWDKDGKNITANTTITAQHVEN